ncbi:MAG TPA: response regulator [Dehalococcoidia bacterium]|nr:response regulator [Dehalococcoidia bacterium]
MNTRPPQTDIRICVLDDDESFRRLSQTILRSEGYQCRLIEDLTKAVEEVVATQPDLVMMDLRLGQDVDGVQVLMDLKSKDSPAANVPVLICTASRDLLNANRKLLEELGCLVVEKPFNLDELLAAISSCLSPSS